MCQYCNISGTSCRIVGPNKTKASKALNQNKPQWLISSNRGVSCRISVIEDVIEEYRPILSDGSVSIKGFNYKIYGSEFYGIRF